MEDHRKQHKKPEQYCLTEKGEYERNVHKEKRMRANKKSHRPRMEQSRFTTYCDDCYCDISGHIYSIQNHLICKTCYDDMVNENNYNNKKY